MMTWIVATNLLAPRGFLLVDSAMAPEAMPTPMTVPGPAYYPGPGVAPMAPPVVTGPFDTMVESIFGQPDPDTWRPLPL